MWDCKAGNTGNYLGCGGGWGNCNGGPNEKLAVIVTYDWLASK